MILSAFLRKGLQNDQETICYVRVWMLDFAVCEKANFLMNMKGFQHLECASQNAYKHNGFPMYLL